MTFTTRPELLGTFGMVSTTHWLASQAGMKMLEAGGTAADAAVAAGFVLNVVEPHLNGPLGRGARARPARGRGHAAGALRTGHAPAGATVAHYRSEGLDIIPGSGLLAAVTPGAFDAWMLMLRDHGRLPLAEVLAPAIHYAEHGHPMLAGVASAIAGLQEVFRKEWPTSAPVWLPGGKAPEAGALFRNPDCARCGGVSWPRVRRPGPAGRRRSRRRAAPMPAGSWPRPSTIYLREACVLDATGERRKGVLTGQDMATWQATWEAPLAVDHAGWTVWKCGAWTQGPVLLQVLQMLADDDLGAMDPFGEEFVHLVAEALKRAFADRECYYGDPALHPTFPSTCCCRGTTTPPTAPISARPATTSPPDDPGAETQVAAFLARAARRTPEAGVGAGEPTMAHLVNQRGDTVHVDVVDRWGNMVSATPSGGWLKSNPVVPGLGVPLGTRAQMFWLDEGCRRR
jgi:gamma-glutamyltranspeptidase/glutathione hydrolase